MKKVRYEYGMRRRSTRLEPQIVKHPMWFIRDHFRTMGLQYHHGEIYRRPWGSPSDTPWERCD